MTPRRTTLPLGVDIGTARTRVALAELDGAGEPCLVAVATRPTNGDPAAAIAGAWTELPTRERRCVLALSAPDALLRTARLPVMRPRERTRAARFEAARFIGYGLDEAQVRVVPARGGTAVIGVAHRPRLDLHLAAARRAGLRPIAVDDTSFALLRAFPHADAIVDAGESRTLLVVPGDPAPFVHSIPVGGRSLTAAMVAALGVDEPTAERRKCSVGLGGAGEYARDALVEQLASVLVERRAHARTDLRSIALCGNAGRLSGLAAALERAVAIPVSLGVLHGGAAHVIPPDVVRSASPDWGLAYGLALWEIAA